MIFIIQQAKDFDSTKAGAFGYVLTEWRGVSYRQQISEEHPDLGKIFDNTSKSEAKEKLNSYIDTFYRRNKPELVEAKQRLENQISSDGDQVVEICQRLVPMWQPEGRVIILGLSALPPQIAFVHQDRIDFYYKTNKFMPSLLHELLHIALRDFINGEPAFNKIRQQPESTRYLIESATDLLLSRESVALAEHARTSYDLSSTENEDIWDHHTRLEEKLWALSKTIPTRERT